MGKDLLGRGTACTAKVGRDPDGFGYRFRVTTDVDLARALHTVAATLNDQKLEQFDAERVQEIATGACGGERQLIAYGNGESGELRDGSVDGPAVARLSFESGEWSVERVPEARKS